MKLMHIFRELKEEIDPQAQSSANILLFVDKLRSDPNFNKMVSDLTLPSDKYKAILGFATAIGVPEGRFEDFIQQQRVLSNKSNT